MKTIREMALDYERKISGTDDACDTERAYLAGARAALEIAKQECALVENNIDSLVENADEAWSQSAAECATRISNLIPE